MTCRSIPSSWTVSPPQPELNQQDGLHPTKEGVAVIVGNILPYVEKLLDAPHS